MKKSVKQNMKKNCLQVKIYDFESRAKSYITENHKEFSHESVSFKGRFTAEPKFVHFHVGHSRNVLVLNPANNKFFFVSHPEQYKRIFKQLKNK